MGRTFGRRRNRFQTRFEPLEPRDLPAELLAGFAEAPVATGLSNPTAMEFAPGNRLFITEQGGTMEVFRDGSRLQANFFRDAPLRVDANGERGLLGVAIDPDFDTNRFVYVYYTATSPNTHNRLSRFTADASGTLALAGSEVPLLDVDPLSTATNHNGGAIHFGPDGKLYVAVGDNALGSNSQSLGTLKGKILRINSDGSIPADNPFFNATTGTNRAIWAIGLRNPFTFAFQPGSDRMFINDVGQNTFEEINQGQAGANYGWPTTEGPTANPNFVTPFYHYGRSQGGAITGGAFYNPETNRFPADYAGDYFFADYVSSKIWRIDTSSKAVATFAADVSDPVDLRVGGDGGLYYLSRGLGRVLRVDVANPQGEPPTIARSPSSQTVSPGQPAVFTGLGVGTPPLSYQWQRDGVNIPGARSPSYTLESPTLADNGRKFRLAVSNAFGMTFTSAATLTVTSSQVPTPVINSPGAGGRFNAGDTITFSGSASDPEDGPLPTSALTWQVDYYTGTVVRPFVPATSGISSGTFTVPTISPYTRSDVFFRITLTAKDSDGRTSTVTRDITPNTAQITLQTDPPGLPVFLDGQPYLSPTTFVGVVGLTRPIEAAPTLNFGGATYAFAGWSDGGAEAHVLSTPATATTITATYRLTSARITFQPARVPVPAGYEADNGAVFGVRGAGLSYGWNARNAASARVRNSPRSPDSRYDSFLVQRGRWEIAVPNGEYAVRIVGGDPRVARTQLRFRVEGATAVGGRTTAANRWLDRTVLVTVADGRLTISGTPGFLSNKLNFVEITANPPARI